MDQTKTFQQSQSRGFTLIEILVVLMLMSLILGISTVFLAGALPKAAHRAAARDLVATLKYARNLASAKNERQVITFDLDAGAYGIRGRAGKTLPQETKLVIFDQDMNVDPVTLGQYQIYFEATGTGGWEKMHLIRGDKIIRIKADPILTALIVDDDEEEPRHAK